MNQFAIRIVLHGASLLEYRALATSLAKHGIVDVIYATSGKTYRLPDGDYYLESSMTLAAVEQTVANCATSVVGSSRFQSFVSQTVGSSFRNLEEVQSNNALASSLRGLGAAQLYNFGALQRRTVMSGFGLNPGLSIPRR